MSNLGAIGIAMFALRTTAAWDKRESVCTVPTCRPQEAATTELYRVPHDS